MSNKKTARPAQEKNVTNSNNGPKTLDAQPELALAAIASYRRQKEVGEFILFLLGALERNSDWLNSVLDRQNNFRCALMIGSGPNRFQLQEIIYPNTQNSFKLEVELRDSEDYDKVAIAVLLKLNNLEMDHLSRYIKTRLYDNPLLLEELQKGKGLGFNFAVLRPFAEKQYRIVERIVIGSCVKCAVPVKKRRTEDKSPIKKAKKYEKA